MTINLILKQQYRIPKVVEDINKDTSTANLGIGLIVSYFAMIIYSFYTAYKRKGNIGSAVISKGKDNFTMSQAFYDSEKFISIFFNILYICIGIYICYRKNLFYIEYERIIIIISFIILPILYTLLLYIGPSNPIHYIIAITIFIYSSYTLYTIYNLYKKYYYDNEDYILNTYYQTLIIVYIFGTILSIIFTYYFFKLLLFPNIKLRSNKILIRLLTDILAISEYIIIILIGVLIYIFTIFPSIPKI